MSRRVLLVDDDLHVLEMMAEALAQEGYEITEKGSGEAAVKVLGRKDFELVITDLNMYQADGFAVLKKARERNPDTRVILLTGGTDVTSPLQALSLGFDDYIPKPCGLEEIFKRVANSFQELERKRRVPTSVQSSQQIAVSASRLASP